MVITHRRQTAHLLYLVHVRTRTYRKFSYPTFRMNQSLNRSTEMECDDEETKQCVRAPIGTATENDGASCGLSRSVQKDLFSPLSAPLSAPTVDTVMEETEVQGSLMVESIESQFLNDHTRKMKLLLQLIDSGKLSPGLRAAIELQAEIFMNHIPLTTTGEINFNSYHVSAVYTDPTNTSMSGYTASTEK